MTPEERHDYLQSRIAWLEAEKTDRAIKMMDNSGEPLELARRAKVAWIAAVALVFVALLWNALAPPPAEAMQPPCVIGAECDWRM